MGIMGKQEMHHGSFCHLFSTSNIADLQEIKISKVRNKCINRRHDGLVVTVCRWKISVQLLLVSYFEYVIHCILFVCIEVQQFFSHTRTESQLHEKLTFFP